MSTLYEMAGTTKQAHWLSVRRGERQEDRFALLSASLSEERENHPAMSLKKIHHKLRPDFAGRDAFLRYGMTHGYEPFLKRKFHKTTDSEPHNAAPNLLRGAVLFDVNQVWAGDIFYFTVGGVFCYVVLIEDLYSRKIVGYNASRRMFAEANVAALNMALATRNTAQYDQKLIHHSDKGSQYRSIEYTQKLQHAGIPDQHGQLLLRQRFHGTGKRNHQERVPPAPAHQDLRRPLPILGARCPALQPSTPTPRSQEQDSRRI
ncbi:MAG: DDE-type integrase/transposase/recombinase [Bacteroidetes bacterium]|nr:DDE-type integrase/transposase/recombinase [Bacteroidota bacterium]